MARVVAFHVGGATNEGNVLALANTRPDQTLTLKTERKSTDEPSCGELSVEAAMAAEVPARGEKWKYALTKAQLKQSTRRGGGGG